jgi:large subunit ribosomal protein L25
MDFQETIIGHHRNSGEKKDGFIPCVIYSKNIINAISFFIDKITVQKMYHFMKKNRLLNYVFNLEIDGKKYQAMVRQTQKDYIKDEVTHFDFLELNKESQTDMKVEVVFLNKGSSAVEKGHKMYYMNSPKFLPVRCMGEQTISHIDVDMHSIQSNTILFSDQLNWPSYVKCGLKRIVLKAIPKKVVEKTEQEKKGKKKK